MNQTCPHCQKLVVLPELVRNYGDMPIQCHACNESFFLPAEQVGKTIGAVVRRRCKSCKLPLYVPKMPHITAPLRFVCPNCATPLPTHHRRFWPSWRGTIIAISIGLLIGIIGFQLAPLPDETAQDSVTALHRMVIMSATAITNWAMTLYEAL